MSEEYYSIEEDLEETMKCLKEANKEIERLNNIINELEKILLEKIEAVKYMKEILGTSVYDISPHIDILEKEYNYFSDKIKELKGSDKE